MRQARYDAVADFYRAGWTDSYDDPASTALFALAGPLDGTRVLDLACGHGRITRELRRRGADVLGVDLSARQIENAEAAERTDPLGARYLVADISAPDTGIEPASYDLATCAFGLSDIDDLDGCLRTVATALRGSGALVFSILHPCFPGAGEVSGSWPADGTYYDETWSTADGAASTLRQQVGANHRTLSTYLNALRRHGLCLDTIAEPPPAPAWTATRPGTARYPVYLAARCTPQH
jgi:2-polyprenyl-3-methyl-5-hydroxy-6-metoxy-1,4-benzoquinol methylase